MDTDQSVNTSTDLRPRSRRPYDRSGEITRAALQLFVTRGFAATKLEDVARVAGVSKGLPYVYFRSKEDLFKAVIAEAIGDPLVRATEFVDGFDGPAEQLLRELVAMFRPKHNTGVIFLNSNVRSFSRDMFANLIKV